MIIERHFTLESNPHCVAMDPSQYSTQSNDDSSLVQRMAGGDTVALRQFYDRHSSIAYAMCLRILRDPHLAEEVLVDVFHEFWRRAATHDESRGTPIAMLINLARSRAIDRKRSLGKISQLSLEDRDLGPLAGAAPSPDQVLDERQQIQLMRSAMATLEENQRQALQCAYYDGMTHSEIAVSLNKPLGTVKSYIRQGLLQLRKTLSRRADAPRADASEGAAQDYA